MIIYVVQAYDGDYKDDVLVTTKKGDVKDFLTTSLFQNKFSEDFDIVGYSIPKSVSNKYHIKNASDAIYREWIMNKSCIEEVNESVVFYQVWNKKVG